MTYIDSIAKQKLRTCQSELRMGLLSLHSIPMYCKFNSVRCCNEFSCSFQMLYPSRI